MNYSLARFSVPASQLRAARQAVQKLLSAVQKHDPGLVYLVFQEGNEPLFVTLVSFESETAYRQHAESRHAATFARTMARLCTERPSFRHLSLTAATAPGKRFADRRPATRRPRHTSLKVSKAASTRRRRATA